MKCIAHLSDLHFGRCDMQIAEQLLVDLDAIEPSIVAVSGDLTQRARHAEFAAARAFLGRIVSPKIVVPGNHDLPLFNLKKRLLEPLERFRRYIEFESLPVLRDGEVAVLGINTARRSLWKDGRISETQLDDLRRACADLPTDCFKVLVTHHPFAPPQRDPQRRLVGRRGRALAVLDGCGVELLLTGHLHRGFATDIETAPAGRSSILIAQAGTAISTRRRGESNAYNVIRVEPARVEIEVRRWTGSRFAAAETSSYQRVGGRWIASASGASR